MIWIIASAARMCNLGPSLPHRGTPSKHGEGEVSAMIINALRGGGRSRTTSAKVEELNRVPLFRDIPDKSVERIAEAAVPVSYGPDEVVFRQGDPGLGVFVILEGRVRVSLDGKEAAQLPAGGFFGEMSVLDDFPRSATVTAMEDTHCLEVKRADFLRELERQPDIAFELLAVLSRRVRDLDARVRLMQSAIPDEWLT
ncbi:MAG: cyclic nucleotide-binding domain-containing protein [Chloroflexi bacterium]|nr:cyclic nucleotide-binding domain-containing protein [Chloroflexota bacterium]